MRINIWGEVFMIENKRFILKSDYDWWGVVDTSGEIKGAYSDCFTTDDVVDLLNEQNEEIIKLKIENQILQGENEDLNEDLLQLESFRNLLKSKGIDLDD